MSSLAHSSGQGAASIPTALPVSEGVLFCAFRYALGRMTYVVEEVAEAIVQHAGSLSERTRHQMAYEIGLARRREGLGMPIDALSWAAVERALEQATTASSVGTQERSDGVQQNTRLDSPNG